MRPPRDHCGPDSMARLVRRVACSRNLRRCENEKAHPDFRPGRAFAYVRAGAESYRDWYFGEERYPDTVSLPTELITIS